jgi:uridine phosphorylase
MPIPDKYLSAVSRRTGPRVHIQCDEGQVGSYVLLPGDPGRVPLVAGRLAGASEIAHFREFRTFTGQLDGVPVTVTSTGVGGPSAAIAVEELAQLGAHTFIRIGTAGAMQPDVRVGEIVIATGAIRDEGTTRQYVPIAYPAVSDRAVVNALVESATELKATYRVGVVHSKDSFYGQHEPTRMPASSELVARYDAWVRSGALCSEMETAAILIVAGAVLGLRSGSVLAVAGNQESGEHLDLPGVRERRDRAVGDAIDCAIGALRRLIAVGK